MIYLDNAATTIPYESVISQMTDCLTNHFGNPSSLHSLGLDSETMIANARATLAKSINAKEREIYFSPNGTLANNTAILGYLRRNKRGGKKLLVSSVEHSSVYNVFEALKEEYEILYIPIIDSQLDHDFIYDNLDENTALISVMNVNNETGTIFDIKKIKNIVNSKKLKTVIHCDCIQSYMKVPINVNDFPADLLTMSAHKIGGPKGIGGIYVRTGTNISPIYFGGGQEKNLFSGTECVANILGFNSAIAENIKNSPSMLFQELNKVFLENLDSRILVNSKNSVPNIINISLNIRSEIALHILESKGIFISSGSACSQKKGEKNRVLKNFLIRDGQVDTALRVSFGYQNTTDDILIATKEINAIYEKNA